MTIDLRHVECFITVAREESFTRAAQMLGIAQSNVSDRLRRLEAVLGFPLLERTSRRVELSPAGGSFLPLAQALLQQEQDALRAARDIRSRLANTLRIGACEYQAVLPPRRRLIEDFMMRHPEVRLDIIHGAVPDLIAQLARGEIECVLALNVARVERQALEVVRVARLDAYIIIPQEDPLAAEVTAELSALSGRHVLLSPGRHDPEIIESLAATFRHHGARVSFAPEADRATIEHSARLQRACCLRWEDFGLPNYVWMDMKVLPLTGSPFSGGFDIVYRRGQVGAGLRKLLATVPVR